MKSLDTNVIIRFLVNDDKKQSEIVRALFLQAEKDGSSFNISVPVLLETLYVLDSVYEYKRDEILNAVESMLHMKIFSFQNPDVIQQLVAAGNKSKIELEDLFIGLSAKEYGCEPTITFDKKAAKSDLFELIE